MDDQLGLSVVIPSYLEEENLRILLPRVQGALDKIPLSAEIIVVDTTVPLDSTEEVAREFGSRHIRRRPGNCFGDAVRTGIEEARGRVIVLMDADGSHAPELIPELVRGTESHEVVIASRYVHGGYTENDFLLKLMSQVLNVSYSLVLGLKVKDVSNSFRAYRMSALTGIRLKCKNFDVVEELLYKIKRRNPSVRMKEIPCTFKKRMFGRTKRNLLLFMLTYLVTILRLRFGSQ